MRTRHEIDYRGLKIEVVGFYYKGTNASWENPGDPQEFEIHEVFLKGIDISPLFDDYHELERLTLLEHYI